MALLKFSPYQPDLSDLDMDVTDKVLNVVPRADGYGPFPSFATFSQALPGPCRGYFYARKSDGSTAVFASTSTDLYLLNGITLGWIKVSKGNVSYSALVSTDMWRFVQFNNFVIACQVNTVLQSYDLTSSTNFIDLANAPQAKHVAIVNRFLVVSGVLNNPYRVQWSGLNQLTTWDNVTAQSNFQDLADGGLAHEIAGGEYGIIFQDTCIRRMIFAPGAPYTFQIERLAQDDGLYGVYAVVRAGDEIHFVSPQGFKKIVPNGYPTPIGKERVDRTFFGDIDGSNLQLLMGATDPTSTRVYWAYKSGAGSSNIFDTILIYDRVIDRWTKILTKGEYLATLAAPGLTLEGLDSIASGNVSITGAANNGSTTVRLTVNSLTGSGPSPTNLNNENFIYVYGVNGTTEANNTVGNPHWNFTIVDSTHIDLIGSKFVNAYTTGGTIGGSIDQMSVSFDSLTLAAQAKLSMVDNNNILGFFAGTNLEAQIETTEADLGGQRIFINGIRPFTDAAVVYGSMFVKDTAMGNAVQTGETLVNAIGVCPQRIETRYARARVRIPAGTTWTFAEGVEPIDTVVGGER